MILHKQTGLMCDPQLGVAYGKRGKPLAALVAGYPCATVIYPDRRATYYVHRIIYEAVNGPIPDGMQINHINGIKTDNRIGNLELVTPTDNKRHAYATGLNPARGEGAGHSKLTESAVRAMRLEPPSVSSYELARRYGVSPTTAHYARTGRTWRHVSDGEALVAE